MRRHIFKKENKLKRIIAICVVAIMLYGLVAPTFASEASEQNQETVQQENVDAPSTGKSEKESNEDVVPEIQGGENRNQTPITSNKETENTDSSDQKTNSSEEAENPDSSDQKMNSSEETEKYPDMSKKLTCIADDSIQMSSFSDDSEVALADNSESYGGKTISVSKGWRGDETSTDNRPQAVTFNLYASNATEPIDTLTLTKKDVTMSGGSTWKGTFAGKYPLYDNNGEKITYTVTEASVTAKDKNGQDKVYKLDDNQTVTYPVYKNGSVVESPTYRCVQNSDDTTTSEGYENVSAFVPVTQIEDGVDYLVSSGNNGNVKIYRAEAYQTDNMLATAEGDVSAVVDGRKIEGINSDGTTTEYSDYILVGDDETGAAVGNDGKYLTDYMTWRAQYVNNNTCVLASNFYRLCGLVENNDAGKYPGYMSTEKDKGDGLCVYKNNITSWSEAPKNTQFSYDSTTGGFKTPGSDKVVYLYKKITLAKGTLENQTQTVGMTNWKNSSISGDKDPMDNGDQSEPEPYTNISVSKVWADGKDHSGETVNVVLYANGVEQKEMSLGAVSDWKGTFSSLPTKDSDGKDITYTIGEKSVKDSSGKTVSYISAIEDTTDIKTEKTKIWLPVDRPSKKVGGEDYIVIAFPSTRAEIGQNIWGNGSATRKALTSNPEGTKFAMGTKNSGNTDGASMDVVVTEGPVTVGGKTYTNYITDDQARNADGSLRTTIMWRVNYVGTASKAVASHADYGPWPRDLFSFQTLAGKGGYLSTQGAMTLESSIDTKKFENNRSLFAYGMMYSSDWGEFKSMTQQGYTKDQITHMIGAMDHYALRSDKSPGKFGEKDCTYPAMYLYKGVEVTNKSYTITNTSKREITAQKIWDDDDNVDHKRPSTISVELFKNGTSTGKLLYLSEKNGWKATFDQLDVADSEGNAYEYSIKEHVSNANDYKISYETVTDKDGNLTIKITNKLKNSIEIPVEKRWADGNDNHRGTTVEVQLLADGVVCENGQVTLGKDNNWKHTFKDLPKYKEDGKTEIQYTVKEIEIPGYKAAITGNMKDGYLITNMPVAIVVPETGNPGELNMIILGIGLLTGGILLMINNKKRGVIRKE